MTVPLERQLLPSLLSADFYHLEADIKAIENAGVTHLHLDVMDGHFVPNISFGPGVIACLRKQTTLFFDAHLMVEEPDFILPAMQKAGCDLVTVQWEACRHIHRTLQRIHELGMRAGVSLNPATPPQVLEYIMDSVDLILVMSVNPGFGGQTFIESAYKKIQTVRQMIDQSGRPIVLEVDGGIKEENLQSVAKAGANWLVAGSAVFGPGNVEERAAQMRTLLAGI